MNRFARLLDDLIFSPSRLAKERLLVDYFTGVPDPARGYALGALTGALDFRHAKPAAPTGRPRWPRRRSRAGAA